MVYIFAWLVAAWSLFIYSHGSPPDLPWTQGPQHALGLNEDVDIVTGSAFSGLTTFANLPYANCFADSPIEEYDIAILGAPFDTVRLPTFPSEARAFRSIHSFRTHRVIYNTC